MIERVIYGDGQGCGIICTGRDRPEIEKVNIELCSGNLIPGQFTTLGNLYEQEIEYLGILPFEDVPGSKPMVFHLGSTNDLFGTTDYYSVWFWIAKDRVYQKYAVSSGRDYNWRKGAWK